MKSDILPGYAVNGLEWMTSRLLFMSGTDSNNPRPLLAIRVHILFYHAGSVFWLKTMRGIRAFIANHLGPFISMDCLEFLVNLKRAEETTFLFNGVRLEYFFHSYNNFRIRERTIEVPIISYYLQNINPKEILEIGNVSSHYYTHFRELFKEPVTVVDKYENGFNVISIDISRYQPGKKFDFIFSISTFEHMDDEREYQDRLPSAPDTCIALENMHYVVRNLLKPQGTFVLTVPIGQNPKFERCFSAGDLSKIPCRSMNTFLLRRTRELQWRQIPLDGVIIPGQPETSRDSDFQGVNSVLIIEIVAPE